MTVKTQLLEYLQSHTQAPVSGEALAGQLGCSRNAVWKAVKALEEEGYRIEAVRRQGYRLVEKPGGITRESLRILLDHPEGQVYVYDTLPSTNTTAMNLAAAGKAGHGSVVCALAQTEGRGRRGKRFYSPPEAGLYFSVVLRPRGSMTDGIRITTAAAVAVYQAVEKVCSVCLDIKWINDLYREGRKVCGILTQAQTDFESGGIEYAVVGIGVNLYVETERVPRELREIMGGIFQSREEAEGIDRSLLLGEITNRLLTLTEAGGEIPEEYFTRNLVKSGTQVELLDGSGGASMGRAAVRAILPDGRLSVVLENGEERTLAYGEVHVPKGYKDLS